MRKKCVFPVIIVFMILSIILCTQTQTVMGGGAGGGMGAGRGGGMGGGGRMAPVSVQRPDKAARLASIAEIEKQLVGLKGAIQKSQAQDPCASTLSPEALTAYTAQYTEESDAITQIVTALNNIRPVAGGFGGGRGGMMGGVGLTTEQITELTALARQDNAEKLTSKLEALAKEAAAAPTVNRGGGTGGSRGGSRAPAGGFEWMD